MVIMMTDTERDIWYEELEKARSEFVDSVFRDFEKNNPTFSNDFFSRDREGDKETWYSARWYCAGAMSITAYKYCGNAADEENSLSYGVNVLTQDTERTFDIRLTKREFSRLMRILERENHENQKHPSGE
jgi:hypothetical protein